jgi:hypothetical protein
MSSDIPRDESLQPEAAEDMVDASCIETVFTDRELLSAIALRLMGEGLVTGYMIFPSEGGYFHRGKLRGRQIQYMLRVLIPVSATETSSRIQPIIKTELSRYWDRPLVSERPVRVQKEDLTYISDATTEHHLFVRERRVKRTVACVAGALITALLAVLGKHFLDNRELDIRHAELQGIATDLRALEGQIREDMRGIDSLLTQGKSLTPLQSDMAAINPYLETDTAERHTRELREKVDHLIQVLEMDRHPPKEASGGTLPRGVKRQIDRYPSPRPYRPSHRSNDD